MFLHFIADDCTYRLLYEELKSEQYELVAKQEIERLKKQYEDLKYVFDVH